jgi:hypothetical protein
MGFYYYEAKSYNWSIELLPRKEQRFKVTNFRFRDRLQYVADEFIFELPLYGGAMQRRALE